MNISSTYLFSLELDNDKPFDATILRDVGKKEIGVNNKFPTFGHYKTVLTTTVPFDYKYDMPKENENPVWKVQEGTVTMLIAEVVGTGILIFVGCMGCIGSMGPAPPPPLQMALTFGLTVNLIIMMLGHVSGAHLNPAVTIGAVIIGLKSIPTGILYIAAQFVGATLGYGLLMVATPPELFNDGNPNSTAGLCVTVVHPDVSTVQAILIEVFCTSFILLGACATWDPRCAHTTDSTALRFGFSVAAISFAAAPYTGCSMNPARTFGPAYWNSNWTDQWIYWFGPVCGALLGTYTYQIFFSDKTSSRRNSVSSNVEMKEFSLPTEQPR